MEGRISLTPQGEIWLISRAIKVAFVEGLALAAVAAQQRRARERKRKENMFANNYYTQHRDTRPAAYEGHKKCGFVYLGSRILSPRRREGSDSIHIYLIHC